MLVGVGDSRKNRPHHNVPVEGSLCHWGVVVQCFHLLQNVCRSGGVRRVYSMAYHGRGPFIHSGGQNGIKDTLPYLLARMVLYFLLPFHLLRNGFCPPDRKSS